MMNPAAGNDAWRDVIPNEALDLLACSSVGASRLMRALRLMNEGPGAPGNAARAALHAAIMADMALAAWEAFPYDFQACGILSQVEEQRPFLRPAVLETARRGASPPAGLGPELRRLNALMDSGDIPSLKTELEKLGEAFPGAVILSGMAWGLGLLHGESEWCEAWMAKEETRGLPPLLVCLARADLLFFRECYSESLAIYEREFRLHALPSLLVKSGECLFRLGERDRAAEAWAGARRLRPWDANLTLRLADLLRGLDRPGRRPEGRGAVLLYSWNHAEDLDTCLQALADSKAGDLPVLALNNGSTDDTAAVLARWRNHLGPRLETISLPVNVGVPAARNWLLSLPAAREADWVVFLDDDATIPPDWAGYFGQALREYPGAGIVGCRIRDLAVPAVTQSVDGHLEAPGQGRAQDGLNMGEFHLNIPDFDDFRYMRPCLSVTGCCHLLTRKSLDACGPFDLRFAPSQFEDLERDLRCALAGQRIIYNGHLAVIHRKRSGLASGVSAFQRSNIQGNLLKLRLGLPDGAGALLRGADKAAMADQWRISHEYIKKSKILKKDCF